MSFSVSLMMLAAGLSAATAEGTSKGAENWDGSIEFNAAFASGNTNNGVLGARFEARRVLGRFTHDIEAHWNYTESEQTIDGEKQTRITQRRWAAQYRAEMQVADRTFAYLRGRHEEDDFSGFHRREFLGTGIGHTAIERENAMWSLLIGPGVQYTVFEEPADVGDGEWDRELTDIVVYAGSDFSWTMRENVTLEHDFDVTHAELNTSLSTKASIKTKLTEKISSRVSYLIKHETDPPGNREQTDRLLTASIGIGF